jgi:hypothetical protein
VASKKQSVEQWLDQRDLERLEADNWYGLVGYEDRPRKTFSKGRRSLNLTPEEAEIFRTYAEEENAE